MENGKDRRKLANIVIDSRAQLRLFVPFGLMLITSIVIMVLMYRQVGVMLNETLSAHDDTVALQTAAALTELSGRIFHIAGVGVVSMGMICLVTWLMYSHRIFGPVVPMRRHVANLRSGNFETEIKLRKFDEFKPLADDLNGLAAQLRESGK
jgi:hypothetical protein